MREIIEGITVETGVVSIEYAAVNCSEVGRNEPFFVSLLVCLYLPF